MDPELEVVLKRFEAVPPETLTDEDRAKIAALIKSHFDAGGTQINVNIIDKRMLLEAEKDPSKCPDLIVRVTGFSAYFASLSPEFRHWVIERVVQS